jgi:hypothetical protein
MVQEVRAWYGDWRGAVPGIGMRFLRARPGTDERSCAGLMENHHREGGGVDGLRTAPAEETWS